jgi:peptide-methionine (R)-S-oxide reductase
MPPLKRFLTTVHQVSKFTALRYVAGIVAIALCSGDQLQSAEPTKPAAKANTDSAGPQSTNQKTVNKEDLKKRLSPLQFEVTCNAATEPPFRNAYWDNHAPGLYVDVIDGEPLFASNHKFDSGSGWPSFFQPVEKSALVEKQDKSHGMVRIEVISKKSGAHLGHLFPDGPRPTGMRYCINSASLRFIPVNELEKEGYGKFKKLFEEATAPSSSATPKP